MSVNVKPGQRVVVKEKDLKGTVAYVGLTEFAAGKWIGIILDEPKGKNNGTVQGKAYFQCDDNHGMFVRQTQVALDDEEGDRPSSRASSTTSTSAKDSPRSETPRATKLSSPRSAIPKPGATKLASTPTGRGPTGSRSPSYTNLKAAKEKKEASTPQARMKKEHSFVEKDFQQTLTTSGLGNTSSFMQSPMAAASPSVAMQERIEERIASAEAQQELLRSKDTIRDLEEKLETLKVKRAKDQEKMMEFERNKLQLEQLLEFKSRIMEAHSGLQKELQQAKHEKREAIEAKEKHAEEMSELAETVEMATLDKEMAEEKADMLQTELEAAKEKIELLKLDLDIIKEQVGEDGKEGEGGVTNFEMKQQQAQNEKLRETLVKMRDLLAHEKNVNMNIAKDLEEKTSQNNDLSKTNGKLVKQNEELENTIADLQEQVDAALGAEEMVENLSTKCLNMEEKIASLIEEKEDLEKLHELNEELQENAREEEIQLREELDLAQGKIRELIRGREAAYEIINDHEKTIMNFRDHVKKIQDQNLDLRASLEKETNKPVSTPAEMLNFKVKFEETKAQSKAIDMELRICEERQAKQHVGYLSSYMSDSFMARGGDNEAILVLLLLPRMIWKAEILKSQVKETFYTIPAEAVDKETLLKGHDVERLTFGNQVVHFLDALVAQLKQFSSAMNTCSADTFLKVGTLYPEMSVHERSVDFYLDLLRKNQLDENVPIDNLEKGLQYFQTVYPQHLGTEKVDHPSFLRSHVKAISSAFDALGIEFSIGKILLAQGQDSSDIGTALKIAEGEVGQLKQLSRTMKRRLPSDESVDALVVFPASTAQRFTDLVHSLTPLVKALHAFSRNASQQAGLAGEVEVNATKLSEIMHQAIDKVYQFNEAGLDTIKNTLSGAMKTMTDLSKKYQDGEWDVESLPAKPQPPVKLRAHAFKAEIKEAQSLKIKLEEKDHDIKELKLVLRSKGDELSEMQVRKDKAEKKLLDASRDSDLMREKLQRKVDDLQTLLKKKEKEYEDTMKHFQKDIENLESEKGNLKDKIKDITKQTLFKEINKKVASGQAMGSSGPTSIGPSVPLPVKDSPMLKQQLQDMQSALIILQNKNYNREAEEMRKRLANMKPIQVPKSILHDNGSKDMEKADASKDEFPTLIDLMKRAQTLQKEINVNLVTAPKLVDLKKKTASAEVMSHLLQQKAKQELLKQEAEQLHLAVAQLKASRLVVGF